MKTKIFLLLAVLVLIAYSGHSQSFSAEDSTITFKNEEGKVLTKEEVKELMKKTYSIMQETVNGKKFITIIPAENDELAKVYAKIDAFKNSLINKPIKSFQFTDLENNKWKSKDLKGKIVLINFWFTSCKPCIMEMPLLNELVAANKDKPIVFLAPALDNQAQIKFFLKKFKFDYSIIPYAEQYSNALNIEYFPTHIIIDKAGIIRQVIISYSDDIKEKLQAEIDRLIN